MTKSFHKLPRKPAIGPVVHSRELLLRLYRTLYTIRQFERRGIQLYRQGHIRGYFHPYLGEEAIATGACAALRVGTDYIASTHRGHGHCIAWGADLKRMTAELLGKATGYCRGRGGSMHIADVTTGNLGANGVVAAGIPIAVGAALGAQIRKEDRIACCFCSDGASNNGTFAEALNLAGSWNLPFILLIENNQYAVSTPSHESTREPNLYKRGIGYGLESFQVDGNDVLAVYDLTRKAMELCQHGKGPVLIEAVTWRHQGHHVNDPGQYMPQDLMDHYKQERDPVDLGRRYLADLGHVAEPEIKALEAAVDAELEEAEVFAKASPEPAVDEFLAEVAATC